jgi:hypothetical protein
VRIHLCKQEHKFHSYVINIRNFDPKAIYDLDLYQTWSFKNFHLFFPNFVDIFNVFIKYETLRFCNELIAYEKRAWMHPGFLIIWLKCSWLQSCLDELFFIMFIFFRCFFLSLVTMFFRLCSCVNLNIFKSFKFKLVWKF